MTPSQQLPQVLDKHLPHSLLDEQLPQVEHAGGTRSGKQGSYSCGQQWKVTPQPTGGAARRPTRSEEGKSNGDTSSGLGAWGSCQAGHQLGGPESLGSHESLGSGLRGSRPLQPTPQPRAHQ